MLNAVQRVTVTAGILIGTAIGIPAGMIASPAAYAALIEEDSPNWDCRTQGNRVCGPDNTQGVAAACYSDRGVIVALWPCHVVVNASTGEGDVYTGLAVA